MKAIFTKTLGIAVLSTALSLNANEPFLKPVGISFTENKGQVRDQNNNPRADVLFSGNNNGLVYHLTQKGISYQLKRVDTWKEVENAKNKVKTKFPDQMTIYRVDIKWMGANLNSVISKGTEVNGVSNYFSPQFPNGGISAKSYSDITYKNIYDGIDLKWYENNGDLEYDFIVKPNADSRKIKFEIKGAQHLSINKNGELEITTPLGTIIEKAPVAYQEQSQIVTRWKIANDNLIIEVGDYDHSKELIIDPCVRVWGTLYGGTTLDRSFGVTVDASGNTYMVGETTSATGIATGGAHQTTIASSFSDAFMVKFNSAGVRQWATYYGGPSNDVAYDVALDATGANVYMCGSTSGTSTAISTVGAHQINAGGVSDAFLVKFNASGTRIWGTYYGGSGVDEARGVSVDATGNVYLYGQTSTNSGTVIASPASYQPTFGGGSLDMFLVKFNSTGARQWGTYFGNTASAEMAGDCDIDASGNIYIAGYSGAGTPALSTVGSHQPIAGGANDAVLAKFATAGTIIWSTYYGGTASEYGKSCVVDNAGNIIMIGYADATTPVGVVSTTGAYQTAYGGSTSDVFMVKFNSTGVRQWGTYYGGTGVDDAGNISSDGAGNIFVCGTTNSGVFGTANTQQPSFGGSTDAFLSAFTPAGARIWGTYYGTSGTEGGEACAAENTNNVYLAGYGNTASAAMTSTGAHQTTYGGGSYDAFLAKFYSCANLSVTITGASTVCASSPLTLTAGGAGITTYTWSTGSNSSTTAISPSITTTYTVSAGNGVAGCIYQDVHTVSVTANPIVNISASSPSVCSGSSATLTASGASTYSWSTGATTTIIAVSPTITTVYTATGTAASGCRDTQTISISTVANPTVNISASSPSVCSGSSATLTASGASTYSWSSGGTGISTSVSPTITTVYTATGTAATGCRDTQTISITSVANPTVNISASSPSICSGSSATLTASGASTYSWSSGGTGTSVSVSPTITTIYTATGTAATGCRDTQTLSLAVTATPTLVTNNYTICSGGTATLTSSGATTYSWSTGATTSSITVSPASNTTYTITGFNGTCTDVNTVSVTVGSSVSIVITPTVPSICIGNSGTLTATGATSYTWNTSATTSSIVVSPTVTTNYTVNGTSGTCSGTRTITVVVNANPTVAATSSSSLICTGNTATLSATGASSYSWNPGSLSGASVAVSPTINTTYTVVGSNAAGCTNTRTVSITVSPCTGISETQQAKGVIAIYPNPNNGEFTLIVPEEGMYAIINSIGQIIETIEIKENSQVISVQGLADGIYYVIGKNSKAKIIVSK